MNKKVLIIAAHPDDEVLGVGGTMIKHIDEGDEVFCLFVVQGGAGSRLEKNSFLVKEVTSLIRKEAEEVSNFLGVKQTFFLDFPDNRLDSVDLLDINKEVEKYIAQIKPEIVYTHYENDLNIDHRIVFQSVITVCRPCNDYCPKEVYSFEVLSGTEWQISGERFKPNVYVNIEKGIEKKIKAMQLYASEIRAYPHSRSPEGINILAQYRGLESGKRYAEAFKLVRKI